MVLQKILYTSGKFYIYIQKEFLLDLTMFNFDLLEQSVRKFKNILSDNNFDTDIIFSRQHYLRFNISITSSLYVYHANYH